jgi:hypothetical protein
MKYSSPLRAAGKRTGTRQNRSALRRAKLKGRYYWSKRTIEGLKEAINYFKQSISIDPSHAEAYSGLADSYALAGDWGYGILPASSRTTVRLAFTPLGAQCGGHVRNEES